MLNLRLRRTADPGSPVDPHRFDAEMHALGARLHREEHEYGPLGFRGMFYRLAENLGVGLPREDLTQRPVLSGRLLPP